MKMLSNWNSSQQSASCPEYQLVQSNTPEQIVIKRLHRYAELTGLPMICVDATLGVVYAKSDSEMVTLLPVEVLKSLSGLEECQVIELASGLVFVAVPLPCIDESEMVAVGYLVSQADNVPEQLILAATMAGLSEEESLLWISQQHSRAPELMQKLINLATREMEHEEQCEVLNNRIAEQEQTLNQTQAGIDFLHYLTRKLQISTEPAELAELCLDRLQTLISAEGHVVWINDEQGSPLCFIQGHVPFDEMGMARLIARFDDHNWERPLVKNCVAGSLLGADFPGLKNFVMVPIGEGQSRNGWIISCNLSSGRSKDSRIESSLIRSIAAMLGTHFHNLELCGQTNELLLGFVRSLISSLDAKDAYTRGHSERVALIARKLGEEMGLPEEDLHDIYVSGLLHDIGKIGINDTILAKPDSLTREEFLEVQKHPMIGYEILKGLKNLQRVLPGVRNHHESFDGTGYPDKLAGDQIPLMARILAVADAYDAMGSDRSYRRGMPVSKIEEIFKDGANRQWDRKVIDAYFEIRDEIERLCLMYSPLQGNLFDKPEQSEEEFEEAVCVG